MPLSNENEITVLEAIIAACRVALSKYENKNSHEAHDPYIIVLPGRYPTTEAEDSKLMSDRNLYTLLPVNARNSIRLRRSEKRLLARTIASTERRIEDLTGEGILCFLRVISMQDDTSKFFCAEKE